MAQANSDSTIASPAVTVTALIRMIISQADRRGGWPSDEAECRPFCGDF
jgi:hypothetical protein